MSKQKAFLSFFFGGLLPVIAFTVIEEKYGTWWGLIAGLVFGGGEIIFELIKYKKVAKATLIGNGLLFAMGGVSLISEDGIWFKLQPAIMEGGMAVVLWGSVWLNKPLLTVMAQSQNLGQNLGQNPGTNPKLSQNPPQNIQLPPIMLNSLTAITFRLGVFFAMHAALATWAALTWSTSAWAWLKGAGVTISMIFYMVGEMFWMRKKIMKF